MKVEYISTSSAAKEIDRTPRTIQRMCRLGQIPCYRLGKSYLIPMNDWQEWKARNLVKVKAG